MAGFVFLNPMIRRKERSVGKTQNHLLRAFTPSEEQELHRIVKATSERLDVVKRAQALLAVHEGGAFTAAAQEKQTLIELAYEQAETVGFPLWCQPR